MSKTESKQYALRRLDTMEYYYTPKKNYYAAPYTTCHWTPDLGRAKLYHWNGIKVLASHERNNRPYAVEIVSVKLVIDEIIQ